MFIYLLCLCVSLITTASLKTPSANFRLHLHNQKRLDQLKKQECNVTKSEAPTTNSPSPVTKFGFDIPTSCGYISMNNEWCDNWTTFYIRQRIKPQIDGLVAENSSTRSKLPTIWKDCQCKMEAVLNSTSTITPAL